MFTDGVGGVSSSNVKFHLAGGAQPLILLPVHLNGAGPLQFILDTGAGTSLLSTELAARLQIKPTGTKEAQTAGGKVAVGLAQVETMSLGEISAENLEVAIVDLSQISRTIGSPVDGDLGYNFFRHFSVTINYHACQLRLCDPKRVSGIDRDAVAHIPMRLAAPAKPLILVDALVNGRGPFPFAVDTGTSTSVISPELAAQLEISGGAAASVTGGAGQMQLRGGSLSSLQIGAAKIQDLPVLIGPFLAVLSQAAGSHLDGIIGYNFLRNYKVTIDYPNHLLSLFSPC